MTPKERVLRIINHKEADRVPLDMMVLTEAKNKLLDHYKLNDWNRVLERLNIDIRWINEWEDMGPVEWAKSDPIYIDNWGIDRKNSVAIKHKLQELSSLKDVDNFKFPNPEHALNYNKFYKKCDEFSNYCVLAVVAGPFFTLARDLVRMDNLLIRMIEIPEVITYFFEKINDYYLKVQRNIYEKVGNKIDVLYFGEDLGTQDSLMISKEMIRHFILPNLKKQFKQAKEYGYKVCFHSCGAISEIIPDLIEIGVNILDPIQPRAKRMNIFEFKKEFGDKLAFHGNIDTQKTLPFGTKGMVKKEVIELIKKVSNGGGLIIAPDQFIQYDVPVENIITLYETAVKYGRYNEKT